MILATAPDSKSISVPVDGLGPNGKLVVMGASPEPLSISSNQILGQRLAIPGWASGTAKDSEDRLQFSVLTGVRPMIEHYPLEESAEACKQMLSGKVKFRAVLTMN